MMDEQNKPQTFGEARDELTRRVNAMTDAVMETWPYPRKLLYLMIKIIRIINRVTGKKLK